MRKASPIAEKTSPTKMRAALEWASRNRKPWASRKSQRQKMGRHLIRALTQDGLDEGSQSTKYTQVALKKGTSLGPSLFTWKRQNKDNTQRLGTQKLTVGSKTLLPKAAVHTPALYHWEQRVLTEKPSLSGSKQPAGCESHYHPEAQLTRTG